MIDKGEYYSVKKKDVKLKRLSNSIAVKCQQDIDKGKLKTIVKKNFTTDKKFHISIRQMPSYGYAIISFPEVDDETMEQMVKDLKKSKDIDHVSPVFFNKQLNGKMILTDEIIIKLKEEDEQDEKYTKNHLEAVITSDLKIDRKLKRSKNTYIIKVNKNQDILKTIHSLNKNKIVEYAEPNFLSQIHFHYTPTDPYFPEQWGLDYQADLEGDPDAGIQACAAWDVAGLGSPDIVVAVIDDGVEIDHEDLRDNIWTNPGEIPNNGKDDDNNNYVDDVHGWNFHSKNNDPNPTYVDEQNFDAHGTCCAGIVAASENNGLGGVGVAPNVKILPVKISSAMNLANWSISFDEVDSGSYGGQIEFDLLDCPVPYSDLLLTVHAYNKKIQLENPQVLL